MGGTAVLKGVMFIVDDKGEKTGVVIDLKDNAELWEDIYDGAVARRRASTSSRSHGRRAGSSRGSLGQLSQGS